MTNVVQPGASSHRTSTLTTRRTEVEVLADAHDEHAVRVFLRVRVLVDRLPPVRARDAALRTMHDARVPALALSWRMYSWWDVQPYDDLARVGRWSFNRTAELKNALAWWPSRQVYLDAALISAETMTDFHRALHRVRPRLLEGYVGALLSFADFLQERGLTIPSPRAIATTAEPLTPGARRRRG